MTYKEDAEPPCARPLLLRVEWHRRPEGLVYSLSSDGLLAVASVLQELVYACELASDIDTDLVVEAERIASHLSQALAISQAGLQS